MENRERCQTCVLDSWWVGQKEHRAHLELPEPWEHSLDDFAHHVLVDVETEIRLKSYFLISIFFNSA